MKIEVFLDLDGVIADLVKGVASFYGVPNPYLNPNNLGNYHLDQIFGMTPADFWKPLDYDFWYSLEFMPDALQIMGNIFRYIDEKSTTILTSPISTLGCVEGKAAWIRKNMSRWGRRFLIGSGKEAIAAPNKLLIDDYDKNVDAWVLAGGPAILVPRPWNSLHAISTLDYVGNELHRFFK